MNETATLHNDNGTIETVTINDSMFGRGGYAGIIHENGEFEFVEVFSLTTGKHDTDTCELCEEMRGA